MPKDYHPILTHEQQAIVTLWYLVNLSVPVYAKLIAQFGNAEQAIHATLAQWQALHLHDNHLKRFADFIHANRQCDFLTQTTQQLSQGQYGMVFYDDPLYPTPLKNIFDPPPLLFYQGNLQALSMPQLAIVGSRKPSPHAEKIAFDMAQYLAHEGLWITSGMAEGIDKQAHLGALSLHQTGKQGRTIAVLGNGICQCYPKYHANLKQQIIESGGCVISELLPDMPSNRYHFPRRNRLVAGLSLATLVVEAATKSGSLITAKEANEQGKQVFAIPSHIDNVNAKGCHELIRQGATLIDHPSQILEDLSIFKSPISTMDDNNPASLASNTPQLTQPTASTNQPTSMSAPVAESQNANVVSAELPPYLPPYLHRLLNQLDWVGQDLDSLVQNTQTDIATLTGWLIELELSGLVMQRGGLYMRCRS